MSSVDLKKSFWLKRWDLKAMYDEYLTTSTNDPFSFTYFRKCILEQKTLDRTPRWFKANSYYETKEYKKMMSRITMRQKRKHNIIKQNFERLKQIAHLLQKDKPNYYLNILKCHHSNNTATTTLN
jgi:hypothetical protein